MQFTFPATAALLAGTESMARARPRRSIFVMATLLFLVGGLVRPMAALAGAFTTALLLIPAAALSGSSGRLRIQRLAGVLLIAVSGCAALLYCDGVLYGRSADWHEYYQYKWMIARLFEWGGELSGEQVDALRASVGWSANDWNLLQGMWGVDPEMYGFTRVAAAYETIVGKAAGRDWIEWLTARLTVIDGAALARLGRSTAGLVLVGGVLAGAYGRRRSWIASGLVVGLFLVVCVGIEVGFKEIPLRLLAPLACGFLAALLVTVGSLRRPPASPVTVVLCLGVVLSVLAYEGRAVVAGAGRRPASLAASRRRGRALPAAGTVAGGAAFRYVPRRALVAPVPPASRADDDDRARPPEHPESVVLTESERAELIRLTKRARANRAVAFLLRPRVFSDT